MLIFDVSSTHPSPSSSIRYTRSIMFTNLLCLIDNPPIQWLSSKYFCSKSIVVIKTEKSSKASKPCKMVGVVVSCGPQFLLLNEVFIRPTLKCPPDTGSAGTDLVISVTIRMEVNWDTARWSCLALLLRNSVVINCAGADGWVRC